MDNVFKHPSILKNLTRSLPIGSISSNVKHLPQVEEATRYQFEVNELFDTFSRITERLEDNLFSAFSFEEELVEVQQLRIELQKLTTENKKLIAQLPAPHLCCDKYLEQPLDLTKFNVHEREISELLGLATPKVLPLKNEITTDAIKSTLTPGLMTTLGRSVSSTFYPSQPQQDGAIQTTITTKHSCSGKRALAAENSPTSFNQSSDNVDEQQRKKMRVKEIASVNMDVIRKHLDKHTIVEDGIEFVEIGANGTKVLKKFLMELNWRNTGAAITRKLLSRIFHHNTLATHTLTGKPSPAFLDMNKPEKGQLNQLIVNDLVEFMMFTKNMKAKDVKTSISTKCADECKKFRRSVSATAFAPTQANVIIKAEPMSAVLCERNVLMEPVAMCLDLSEGNVKISPEALPSVPSQ